MPGSRPADKMNNNNNNEEKYFRVCFDFLGAAIWELSGFFSATKDSVGGMLSAALAYDFRRNWFLELFIW